jgi:hypothetical protein
MICLIFISWGIDGRDVLERTRAFFDLILNPGNGKSASQTGYGVLQVANESGSTRGTAFQTFSCRRFTSRLKGTLTAGSAAQTKPNA